MLLALNLSLIWASIVGLAYFTYRNRKEPLLAAIDDLKAADAAETAELAVVAQALTDEVARVNALVASLSSTPDADIASVTADLTMHVANLQAIADGLASVAAATPTSDTPPAA